MKLLKTPEQQAEALERVGLLAARGEPLTESQQDELEVLAALCEKYENETQTLVPPTPLEAIRFRMDQMGDKQKALAALVGGASRASEIMAGKRGLTTEMIRSLRDEWHIPSDSLLGGGTLPEPAPSGGLHADLRFGTPNARHGPTASADPGAPSGFLIAVVISQWLKKHTAKAAGLAERPKTSVSRGRSKLLKPCSQANPLVSLKRPSRRCSSPPTRVETKKPPPDPLLEENRIRTAT